MTTHYSRLGRGRETLENSNEKVVTAMSVKMRAEVVSYGQGGLSGVLESQYLEAAYRFTDLFRMIKKMEEVFDSKGFPEKYLKTRTFRKQKDGSKANKSAVSNSAEDDTYTGGQHATSGTKCTFEITVSFRQNATWQGTILWVEKDKTQKFDCVLDILRLIDNALLDGDENAVTVNWGDK